jgi:rhodanese-related sulfurtransferase
VRWSDAQHVPLGSRPQHIAGLPRDLDLLLICRRGNRSGRAIALLSQHGFARAFNVTVGMQAWSGAGLPVTSGT